MHRSSTLSPLSTQATIPPDHVRKSRTLSCRGVLLDLECRRGFVGDQDVGLSAAEFAMVHLLFIHRGLPMSKEAIAAALPVQVDPPMIDVYISRARSKFAAVGLQDTILTVRGRGYMAGDADDEYPMEPPHSSDLDAALVPA